MRELLGRLINWLGWPGFVQETVYRSSKTADVEVRVKNSRLYTVVSVNGVDVYFDRLTGRIDGTGVAATSGSRWGLTARSGHLVLPPETQPQPTQK
jgi:hypothetical protein